MWGWNEVMFMQNVAWCSTKGKSSVHVLSCSCHPLNMEKATKNMRQVSHQQDKAWRTDGWVRVGKCCLSLFQSWGLMGPTSCNLSWGFMSPCLGCWSYIKPSGQDIFQGQLLSYSLFCWPSYSFPPSADCSGWRVCKKSMLVPVSVSLDLFISLSSCLWVCFLLSLSFSFPLGGLMNIVWVCVYVHLSYPCVRLLCLPVLITSNLWK